MPIEVREIVIKANVDNQPEKKAAGNQQQQAESREEIIKECVDQVLEILKREKER